LKLVQAVKQIHHSLVVVVLLRRATSSLPAAQEPLFFERSLVTRAEVPIREEHHHFHFVQPPENASLIRSKQWFFNGGTVAFSSLATLGGWALWDLLYDFYDMGGD